MARLEANQAMTRNPDKLVIGVMQVKIGDSKNVATAAAASFVAADNLGALKSASLSITPSTKEHQSGYPKQTDLSIDEAIEGTLKVEMEEVLRPKCMAFIDTILNSVNTGTTSYHCMEALALFSSGSRLSLFSNYVYLKPTLTLNFGNDFNVAPFEFELLYNPAYTNKKMLYRAFTEDLTGRSDAYQAITQDAAALQIGFFQVRLGRPTPRPAWTPTVGGVNSTTLTGGTTVTADHVVTTSATTMTVSASSASGYTGPWRGKYRVVFDGTDIVVYNPEEVVSLDAGGTPAGTTIAAAGLADNTAPIADGSNLELTFSAFADLVSGDTYEFEVDPAAFRGIPQQVAGTTYAGTATATGSYTGAVDGAFVITATGVGGYDWVAPDGTTGSEGALTSQLLANGVSAAFSAALTGDEVFVIPVYSDDAQTGTRTNILSEYSILSQYDSIGAIQNSSFSVNSTMKEHTSGSPAKKDFAILESSDIAIEVTMEEFNVGSAALTAGEATTVFDMVLDSAVNQTKYFVPVELVAEMATGGTPFRLWLPSCQVIAQFEMGPGDDWAGSPFQLKAVRQTGLTGAPARVYRLTY